MGPRKGYNWKEMWINNGVFIKIEQTGTSFYADRKILCSQEIDTAGDSRDN